MKTAPRTMLKPVAMMIAAAVLTGAAVPGEALRAAEPQAGARDAGAAWPAFRCGPERLGATPDTKGPEPPVKAAWRYQDNKLERVDSSPCVVGDRVYAATGTLRLIGDSTGSIYCRAVAHGAELWSWTGRDFADETIKGDWNKAGKKLKPVFSSPSVGGRFRDKAGRDRFDRHLVVGEGYHCDWNSRIICLDLEPVANGEAKSPRLKWFKQTTCHVESSPCILDGRVYIGAADDGVWCIDLETGATLWRLEGAPAYYVTAGDKADELGKLVGKYVRATGAADRQGAWIEAPGEVTFTLESFSEVADPAAEKLEELDKGRTFRRVVVGKVTRVEKPPMITVDNKRIELAGISKFSIVPDETAPDVESSPVAVRLPKGRANPKGEVHCLSLADGSEIWRFRAPNTILGAVPVFTDEKGKALAYACCRDKNLYVLDVKDQGKIVQKVAIGSPMVCSPAVTRDAVYVTTSGGKVVCVDRKRNVVSWSFPLCPGQEIISSPAVAGDRLFVGSVNKGLFCLANDPEGTTNEPARP